MGIPFLTLNPYHTITMYSETCLANFNCGRKNSIDEALVEFG